MQRRESISEVLHQFSPLLILWKQRGSFWPLGQILSVIFLQAFWNVISKPEKCLWKFIEFCTWLVFERIDLKVVVFIENSQANWRNLLGVIHTEANIHQGCTAYESWWILTSSYVSNSRQYCYLDVKDNPRTHRWIKTMDWLRGQVTSRNVGSKQLY